MITAKFASLIVVHFFATDGVLLSVSDREVNTHGTSRLSRVSQKHLADVNKRRGHLNSASDDSRPVARRSRSSSELSTGESRFRVLHLSKVKIARMGRVYRVRRIMYIERSWRLTIHSVWTVRHESRYRCQWNCDSRTVESIDAEWTPWWIFGGGDQGCESKRRAPCFSRLFYSSKSCIACEYTCANGKLYIARL